MNRYKVSIKELHRKNDSNGTLTNRRRTHFLQASYQSLSYILELERPLCSTRILASH